MVLPLDYGSEDRGESISERLRGVVTYIGQSQDIERLSFGDGWK